jgi:AcrR family transcriptional regulator
MKMQGDRAAKGKRGPKADPGKAREEILAAARAEFGSKGFEGATLRSIATRAKVDVALPSYYFGTKSELFVAALEMPATPGSVLGGVLADGLDGAGERMLRAVLAAWDDPTTGSPMAALTRSMLSRSEIVRGYIEGQLIRSLTEAIGPGSELRAAAFVSQLTGLTVARYILEVEPLASASHDEIVELMAPNLQRYLTG